MDEINGDVYLYDLTLLNQACTFPTLQAQSELEVKIVEHVTDSYKTPNQTTFVFSLPNANNSFCFPKFAKLIYQWNVSEDANIGK